MGNWTRYGGRSKAEEGSGCSLNQLSRIRAKPGFGGSARLTQKPQVRPSWKEGPGSRAKVWGRRALSVRISVVPNTGSCPPGDQPRWRGHCSHPHIPGGRFPGLSIAAPPLRLLSQLISRKGFLHSCKSDTMNNILYWIYLCLSHLLD